MHMRGKDHAQIARDQRGDLFVARGSGSATHHSWTEVNEIGRSVDDHGHCWAGAVRIDDGRTRAENDELSGGGLLRKCRSAEESGQE